MAILERDSELFLFLCSPHLEPRWADRPAFWRSFLSAALVPEPSAMKRIDAYGLQLLGR